MGKSISKAFKKVASGALNTVGLGQEAQKIPDATKVAAAAVETPEEVEQVVDTEDTASQQKQTKRAGKRSLQVSRTSGGGISI